MPFTTLPAFDAYTVEHLLDRAWAMRARCAACHRAKVWYAAELRAMPPSARIADLRPRLTCSGCGSTDGIVDVLNDTGETSRRSLEAYDAKQREAETKKAPRR